MLLTALLAAFMPTTYAADSISINFTHNGVGVTADKTGELGGVAASGWNNVAAANTSGTVVNNQNGAAAGTITISNVHNSWESDIAAGDTLTSVVQKGYIDVPNHDGLGSRVYTITVNHNYWLSDVTFYMSADTTGQYAPIAVNGTAYIGGTNQTGEGGWGDCGDPSGVTTYDDTNSINVTGVCGNIVINNRTPGYYIRATLAGMQIKDATATTGYQVQLGAGSFAAAEQTWSHNGTGVAYADIASGSKYLGVNADTTGSAISFADGETIDSFAALSNSVTVSSDGGIIVKDLYTATGAQAVIDTRVDVTNVRNNGSLKIDANGVLAFKNSNAADTIFNATGTGVIETYQDTVLQGTDHYYYPDTPSTKPAFEGTIAVKGGTLVVGDNSEWNGWWGIDLSSIKSIDLDGGNMRLFAADSDISVVKVKQNASMNIHEATVVNDKGIAIGEIQLDADLTSSATWASTLAIGKLTGTGDLSFSRGGNPYNVSIGSIEGCGTITNGANMNLSIGADAASVINLSNTIENTGTITINGNITIADDLGGFTIVKTDENGELSINGTDGYQITTGSTYLLVNNNGGTVNMTPTTATYAGATTTLTQDENGDVTFVGGTSMDTIYRVNTADITIGGSNATADTGRATGMIVASGRTVTIAGDSDNASASAIFANTSGNGDVVLATDVKLLAGESAKSTGTLTVRDSKLHLAGGNYAMASVANFSNIELDNAEIEFDNQADTFRNVTVSTNGSKMELFDMGDDEKALTFAGTTTLNGNLNVTSTWNSQWYIEKLSGSGNLVIDDAARSQMLVVTIDGSDNYTGQVQVKQRHGNLTMNVAENAGVNVVFTDTSDTGYGGGAREIKTQGIKAGNTITFNGVSGFLPQNTVVDADVVLLNTGTKAALEINNGYATETNKFTGSVSGTGNFLIDKNTTAVHLTYQFAGDVSGWTGKMEVVGGEHDVVYTDANIAADKAVVVNNSVIHSRTNGNANVTFDYTRAATVNSSIQNNAKGMNVTVKNSSEEGTTFTSNSITMTQLTVDTSTKASFVGIENLALASINVKEASSVSIGAQENGTIKASSAKLAGGATIKGNLDLSSASSLTLNYTDKTPVTVTGTLAMELGTALTLDGNVLDAINGLKSGERLDLFSVGNFTIGEALLAVETTTTTTQQHAMSTVFAGEWDEALYLAYDSQDQLVYVFNSAPIPEPATATLSLLALAALAARRRRK